MEEQPMEYFSYLLRIWRTGKEGAWRASLEDPRTGKRAGFGSLEALWAFLQKRMTSFSMCESLNPGGYDECPYGRRFDQERDSDTN